MKILLTTIGFIILSTAVFSQEPADGVFPLKDGQIYYEKVIALDSASKGELFKRTKIWAVDAFRSQKNALQTEDKEEGFIIYKTNFTAPFTMPPLAMIPNPTPSNWTFYCTMRFMIKDNKCKVTIYDFDFESETVYTPKGKSVILDYKALMDPELKKGMMSKGNKVKFYSNAKVTFQAANTRVNEIIADFEKMIKSKENSDF